MPQVKNRNPKRKPVSVRFAIIERVDILVKSYPIYGNRQQFVETSIIEKLDRVLRNEQGFRRLDKKFSK